MIILSPSKQAEDATRLTSGFPYLELAGWAAVGVFARCLSMGMQHRPFLYLWAGVSAGIGYWAFRLEERLTNRLERERDKLVKRRMLRLQQSSE